MDHRIVMVTGGSSGIGLAITSHFLDAGASVAVLDTSEANLTHCKSQLSSERLFPILCDVTQQQDVEHATAAALSKFGRIDVLVNNAGGSFGVSQPIDLIEEADWEKILRLNLTGTFLCIKSVLPQMKSQRYGRIVNISSMAGRGRSVLGGAPYAAAKAGIIGLTRHISI